MNISRYLWEAARSPRKRALPILSFPAARRLGVTVGRLVCDPALQAKAIALIAHETDTLAATGLMDLSVEAEAFGATVRFSDNEVPSITGRLVTDERDARALSVPELTAGRALISVEGIRQAKALIPHKPLLAGMIGPFSLAGRLMDVTEIMYACYDEPDIVRIVLDKCARFLVRYGDAMRRAGADGILMAEPLAGILNADMMAEFSKPYVRRIISALQTDSFGVIYHNCGNAVGVMLREIFAQGAVAYHFGNAADMADVLRQAPASALCMGNIDPAGAFAGGTPRSVAAATRKLMAQCGGYANFLPSSGCDIPAQTDWAVIDAFFDALRQGGF